MAGPLRGRFFKPLIFNPRPRKNQRLNEKGEKNDFKYYAHGLIYQIIDEMKKNRGGKCQTI